MKKYKFIKLITLPLAILLVILSGLLACTSTPAELPDISISSPANGAELEEGNITIRVNVSNFDIVSKLGDATASGEGHIHYYMDAEPPTTQGQPAVTAQGTYAAVTDTSYTWTGVGPGTHTFAVQLVNNNHTPLDPPVTDKITVTVAASVTEEESRQTAEEFVRNSPTFAYDGMADTLELIDTEQGTSATSWIFTFAFDSSHAGYGDRTGMILAQVITPHEAVITVEDGQVTGAILDNIWDMMTQEMMAAMPEVTIATPTVSGDEITVTAIVSNFNLVSKLGEAAAPGEGHLHFYLDTTIPTTPGQPAVSAPGTYAVTTGTSYTWTGLTAGNHMLSVQLVNNNHTPLQPPVTDTVQVTVEENLFSLISGWYMEREVKYYDFGANTPLANGGVLTAPIYALITGMDNDGNPQFVSGQHNIVDVIPGDTGYSDLWRVNLVTVPEDYAADSIRSVSELMGENFTVTQTDILVNCPVVPANSTLETGGALTQGWYKGKAIYYFDFGPNPDIAAPIYALITSMDAQGNPQFVEGQRNIIDVIPGDEGYSAFWRVNLVTVPQEYMPNTFRSVADVMASGYDMTETDILVNCPVVNVGDVAESVNIELSADNTAFNKNTITVPAGAKVTITFSNMDIVPHNFALYETSAATSSIFVGGIINGSETVEYMFTAPATPRTYFFRCDVHPTVMTGDFIVE